MKDLRFFALFLIMLIAACGTDSDSADTSLTLDQLVGVWKVMSVEVTKDTCKFPDMDTSEQEGTYFYLEKGGENSATIYGCDDAACATKMDPETYAYSKGRITIPASQDDMFVAGNCRGYIDVPQSYGTFASASTGSMTMSMTVKFEGDCDAVRAASAEDPNDPTKTMGDYENCQVSMKQTVNKQ